MSNLAISAHSMNVSSAGPATVTSKATATPAVTPTKAEPRLAPDTVKLSATAQAKMMHRQGRSVALIASSLGTSSKTVDGYLGISVASPVTAALKPEPVAQAAATAVPEPIAPKAPEPQPLAIKYKS